VVWVILVGALVVAGAASTVLSRGQWLALLVFLYFGPYKVAALLGLSGEERRRLRGLRLLAFFIWVGLQPRPFLLGYSPPATSPRPTWRGFLLNLLTGAVLLWGVAWLLPPGVPLLVRAWAGLVGLAYLRLFATFDFWALVFRRLGFPVEKPWDNPAAATSLREFWGRRWNRIMSGMLRDLLFTPLARHVGVVAASAAVFLYSGVLHEFVSVLAGGGYGRPTLYFLIQGAGFLLEGTRLGKRALAGAPLLGRCWTALVVLGPVALVVPPAFLLEVIVPVLREAGVPGLGE
jgi:alginate O-acetyltransferase complex protein AlgI